MKTGSLIRRVSIESIHESTRQCLQNPNPRRIFIVNNDFDVDRFGLTGAIGSFEDVTEVKNCNKQDIPLKPMKQLILKKPNENITEVRIRCIFLRLGEISTIDERYYAEILLEASWETSSINDLQSSSFDPSIYWTPKLELMNGIGQLRDDITYSIHYDKHRRATITEHHRLKGTLWERMELKDFPMDIQSLSISITTPHPNSEMIFVENRRKLSGVDRRVFTDEQEWDLFEHVDIDITQQIDELLDNGNNHSMAICSNHAARKCGYFIWNAYFLIFLITSASFTTFPIPLTNIQGRIQIACTLLLTSITFRLLCNKNLPTISYLTALDVYAIGSILSLCLLNIFHGVIGYVNFYLITNTSNSTVSATTVSNIIVVDRWALVVYTILFFAYQIGTFIWVYFVPWKKHRMMIKKDHENRLQIRSTYNNSKATFFDVVSRAKQAFQVSKDQ